MKTKLVKIALGIIPKRLQIKSLIKAMNYLSSDMGFTKDSLHIVLSINDLNGSWGFQYDGYVFSEMPSESSEVDKVEIKSDIETILRLQRKYNIDRAISSSAIEINGSEDNVRSIVNWSKSITQDKLDYLVLRCQKFLHVKPQPYIDLETLTIDDIRCDEDIDYIRDEAFKLEHIDLKLALKVMRVAQQARPSGPLINQKIAQYEQKLERLSSEG